MKHYRAHRERPVSLMARAFRGGACCRRRSAGLTYLGGAGTGHPALPFSGIDRACSRLQSRLTAPPSFPSYGLGTPLPTEGRLSGRIDHGHTDARRAAGDTALLVRPLRQAPRLEPPSPHRRGPRALAPRQARQGQAQACHRSHPGGAASSGRLSDRDRAGIRYRRGRDGVVVAAGAASRHHAGVGIVRRRLGERRAQGTRARGHHGSQIRLRRAAQPRRGRLVERRRLHLERHHVRRAGAGRRLDRR